MDIIHVGEIGMSAASNPDIIDLAAREDRIIVTLDSDFHALLANRGATRPSVIRIREEGLKAPALAKLISQLSTQFAEAMTTGCVLTVHQSKARLRMLPILS